MRVFVCVAPSGLHLEMCLKWKAVGCDSQWGLFPWHQSLSRLGLMAEEMTA